MKEVHNTSDKDQSYICTFETINDRLIRFTYQAYNAVERFNVEILHNFQWVKILSMEEIGIKPNRDAYLWREERRLSQCESLIKMAKPMCLKIINNQTSCKEFTSDSRKISEQI